METFIVHPKNNEEGNVIKAFLKALKIKFENSTINSKESEYNSDFVKTMNKSIKDSNDGNVTRVKLDDIWK